jgi:hypothetical protein
MRETLAIPSPIRVRQRARRCLASLDGGTKKNSSIQDCGFFCAFLIISLKLFLHQCASALMQMHN